MHTWTIKNHKLPPLQAKARMAINLQNTHRQLIVRTRLQSVKNDVCINLQRLSCCINLIRRCTHICSMLSMLILPTNRFNSKFAHTHTEHTHHGAQSTTHTHEGQLIPSCSTDETDQPSISTVPADDCSGRQADEKKSPRWFVNAHSTLQLRMGSPWESHSR